MVCEKCEKEIEIYESDEGYLCHKCGKIFCNNCMPRWKIIDDELVCKNCAEAGMPTKEKWPKTDRELYFYFLEKIKKRHKPGTLDYFVAVIDSIDSAAALKYEKITVAEFRALVKIEIEMAELGGGAHIKQTALKDFFERHGFKIEVEKAGWYVWCISIKEETKNECRENS